jgi:SsrA-binding protein
MEITNKKAGFNYILEPERIEAGISLTGAEAKSLRSGRGDLSNSYAKIIEGEVYLVNANIPCPELSHRDPIRSRKLLLHRGEIISLITRLRAKKLTLVPLKLYTKGHLVKLKLALGHSKRKFEKREDIKKKDIKRELEQELKNS